MSWIKAPGTDVGELERGVKAPSGPIRKEAILLAPKLAA
jgi:hypothetical protein